MSPAQRRNPYRSPLSYEWPVSRPPALLKTQESSSTQSTADPAEPATPTPATPRPASLDPRARLVAPDLARGLALFGIGWANMSTAWLIPSDPAAVPTGLADQITTVAAAMFAHTRGLPMFTLLLGFGIGLIYSSLQRKGYEPKQARRVMYRRYALLGVFGAVHLVLLFHGDVMLPYGLLALLFIPMTKLKDRTLLILAGVLFAVGAVLTTVMVTLQATSSSNPGEGSGGVLEGSGTYLDYLVTNATWLGFSLLALPVVALMYLPLLILGFVAARRGVHRDPLHHFGVLISAVAVGVGVVLVLGLPMGLSGVGLLPQEWWMIFANLNGFFGNLTGPAIAAAILLVCHPLQARLSDDSARPLPWPARPVTALGARSMSGYVVQSLLLVIITQPFTFNFGAELGVFGQLLLITAVWFATALGAWALQAAGQPGPLEKVHRRWAYGKTR